MKILHLCQRFDGLCVTTPDVMSVTNPSSSAIKPPVKSKRVRTGCLTCRERHLKCDEAAPICLNCQKSSRACKRGIKLNFLDTQVYTPLFAAPTELWERVAFKDESRFIASHYCGGILRYSPTSSKDAVRPGSQPREQQIPHLQSASLPDEALLGLVGPSSATQQPSPDQEIQSILSYPTQQTQTHGRPGGPSNWPWWPSLGDNTAFKDELFRKRQNHKRCSSATSIDALVTHPALSRANSPVQLEKETNRLATPPADGGDAAKVKGPRGYIQKASEWMYMHAFIEHIGPWMDCLDRDRHFGRYLPFKVISPAANNGGSTQDDYVVWMAMLACGAKHMASNDPNHDERAIEYRNQANAVLCTTLSNPDRDTERCAITAVILSVYESMYDSGDARNLRPHLSGARALIEECCWDAGVGGIGAACFWLYIATEVMDCVAMELPVAWDPDHWGLDMNFAQDPDPDQMRGAEAEELWVHRMLYILARITNFRACKPQYADASLHVSHMARSNRYTQWKQLKSLCDAWNGACPRIMHPLGYIDRKENLFPDIWLVTRTAVLGRLIYHTGQCILAQHDPCETAGTSEEQRALQLHHAHQICGIVGGLKDKFIWRVALRSIEVAGPSLEAKAEQDELLRILKGSDVRWSSEVTRIQEKLNRCWDHARAMRHSRGQITPQLKTEEVSQAAASPQDPSADHSNAVSLGSSQEMGGMFPDAADLSGRPFLSEASFAVPTSPEIAHAVRLAEVKKNNVRRWEPFHSRPSQGI